MSPQGPLQVRLPFPRTRKKIAHDFKRVVFNAGNFQKMIDFEEQIQLEDSMGFRGQFDEHRRFQIEMLKSQGLKPNHKFLELGCGPLTAGVPVIGYLEPSGYVGIDIRTSVLNLAWREVAKAGLSAKNPRLICSSTFADDVLRDEKFDFIYSFSVLYHLSDEILERYFAAVAKRLAPNGVCLANINTTIANSKWLEFPFLQRSVETYGQIAARHQLQARSLGEIKDLGFRNPTEEKHNPLLKFTRA